MYEEQKLEETFSPIINRRKNDGNRRNLNIFLKDQNNFQKKVERKKKNILLRSESEKQSLYIGHPIINKNSEEMAKKMNNDENVYLRLYKSKSKNKEKEKELEKKLIEEKEKKSLNKKLKKNNAYSHIKSKINIFHKGSNQMSDNNIKNKNNITEPNQDNVKYLKKRTKSAILTGINKKLFDYKDLPTNKILWNQFNKNFENSLNSLNLKNLEEINEFQYYQLLYNLGMISYEPEPVKKDKEKTENKNIIEKNKNEENNPGLLLENSLKIEEDKIINKSFNILKLEKEKDKIKINDIKNFLIFLNQNIIQMN